MSRKVLITGAGGYIGSVASYLFLQNNFEVIGLDNFSTGFKEPLNFLQEKFGNNQFRFYKVDIRDDLAKILEKEKGIEAVLHYAASCKVDESMKNPGLYFANNVGGSENLLDFMDQWGIKKIVFSSTCAVYGEAKYVPVDEAHPTNPANPYGESKEMIEKMVKWYGKLKGFNYVILRYFNVCGASDDGLIGDSKKPSVLLVQNAVRGALGIEPFSLTCGKVETEDGTPIRDYVNVVDLNKAHLLAFNYLLEGGSSEIINLGTGSGNSVLEIVNIVQKITGKKFELKQGEKRQGEYGKMIADIKKAKEILGWEPKSNIEDSVNSLVRWYKNHPQGWEK